MQTIGTLYFLSLKDKRPVSIQHERKSQGTNSKTLKKNLLRICFRYVAVVQLQYNFRKDTS